MFPHTETVVAVTTAKPLLHASSIIGNVAFLDFLFVVEKRIPLKTGTKVIEHF